VTSFRTLESLLEDSLEAELPWPAIAALVVDEAHYVKNPNAGRTRTIASVAKPLRHVIFMTGTPFENRLDEFRVLVSQLQEPIAAQLASSLTSTGDLVIGRHAFQQAVAPVYLRRNQEDVLRELPERIDNEEWVELSKLEERAYIKAVRGENIMGMRRAATIGSGAANCPSSKLERLEELCDEYRESGVKVLVFSFFLDVLAACTKRFDVEGTITGSTPPGERQALIDQFGKRDGHALLLAQIQAGGVGLNIQAASVVCLLEPQWKPSTEEQAIARAHRMGQTRTVLVHRFFTKNSVDERMREVLAEKAELFDAFARNSLIKDTSPDATESSLTRKVIEAEKSRLGQELTEDSV